MKTKLLVATALAAAFAIPAAVAQEGGPPPAPQFKAEKCFGIAKAGKNDCASTGNNSCAGTSKADSDPKAWIYVPEGLCARVVGGTLEPQ